jgi:RHS repeat-associated protein
VILDTTIVTYDSASFRRRPSQVRLPLVKDENGADATPLIKYTAYERRGFGTADTGTFVSLESVYVEIRDPRSFYTRSLLDRWGGARKTWDSLGVIARTQFTADGFVLWAEGKNGDSSRVYNTYDGSWHVTRSYIVRAAADTFRLDSLVYDTNHRVIRRIGASRDTSRYVYDGNGNVTKAISPNNDTTFYTYLSDGRLSAVKLPGNTASRTISYDATWKNPLKRFDESGTMQDSAVFDNLGRDTTHLSKLRVQIATGAATQWQWRWSRTWYNIANEADSSRLLRSVNCADPCTTPPATMADSIRLRHRYDRAGRDSLRINDLGKAVRYGYDRLGRLLSRRPWNDSSAVKDSLLYDVAGNIKKTITRRGEVITVNYDSRNRDTLTVIPGVGTLRRTFGGPLDQLTRLWYDSPVDSIGNVNAELRWGYDQRGRLKADTAYTGTTVRATTYTYDAMERVATRGDPLGTWTTRYETARGFADTLLTPMGDTITYTFDAKSRALGPYIRGGGPLESRVPVWDQTGSLNTLTHSVSTAPSFTALQFDRQVAVDDPQPTEAVLWNEVHGSGASSNFLWDSVTYDGWGRVTSFRALKNGVAVDSESFWFDHNGNIAGSKWGSNYDATTDRLLSRTGDPCGTWNYLYDRAGNDTSAVCGSATWKYSYDALNRLRAVRYNGTLIARYGYDVLGRRIAKRVYSSSSGGVVAYTRFVYSGSAVEFETDSGGVIGLRYTHGPGTDDLLAVRDAAGNHYYIVQDLLRSVRGVVRRDGAWVMSQRFGPYGTVITRDTSTTAVLGFALRYAWTGREYDVETGWYYFRARYFDPNVRRFAQEDPIGYAGGGNVYAYANGNSLEARDPSGLEANYEKMVCHNCGNPLYEQDVYLDGVPFPARWGLDFSGPGFTLNPGLSPWAGLDGARYQRYLVAYERKVQDLVKYFAGVGDKSTALALIYDSHPLGFYGFMNAERAIGILWSEDFGGHLVNSVALTMGQLLEQGAVFFNSVLIQGQKAWSPNLRGQPDGMMSNAFIALRVDGANTAEDIAWTFAHEYGHWITGSNLEGIANGVACAYFFSSSNCHN